ncbi:hypothetical protein KL921_003950 [Ogataea angusta]|uniref:Translation machinery-associated protein 16 n=1 Tax=Pichia angusta TaxID=870730 RepID=A0AAN6DCC7_PICAN|nr:uncharacterized protein KL928_004386 [Ogataea angusta]KAG7807655.1 hypothetical protein KL921_003950 [Ogataea angusta]KAG7816922.1 hypothetical protein KL928_004386 [Ogataea angusta]KAG7823341.1 hypothetical protein KL909_003364 [Ogataea angusta]KAG7844540.1 hypothetical protein KL941_003916 [Ogataea angusta]KAG7857582.1 hypothetical protein KL939_003470 [Ogataea angusta]
MPKSLSSVNKKLKNAKLLHPKGRRAKLISRATLREENLAKRKLAQQEKKSNELQIVTYFQQVITENEQYSSKPQFSLEELQKFIEEFITRDDEELEELRAERRPGRPASKRQDLLEIRRKQEVHVYETGWNVPDLRDPKTVKLLRNWNGDRGSLTALKFGVVKKSDM